MTSVPGVPHIRDFLAVMTVVGLLLSVAAVVFGWRAVRSELVPRRDRYRWAVEAGYPANAAQPNTAGAGADAARAALEPTGTLLDVLYVREVVAESVLDSADDKFRRYGRMMLGGVLLQSVARVWSLYL